MTFPNIRHAAIPPALADAQFMLRDKATGLMVYLTGAEVVALIGVGGGTIGVPTLVSALLSKAVSLSGFQRNARDMLRAGVCINILPGSDQVRNAAMLDMLNVRWVRVALISNGVSNVPALVALRAAMVARGMAQPSPKVVGLCMAYINDSTTLAQNIAAAVEAANAGLLTIWEGPNELNNQYTGNGTHSPTDNTQHSTDALWPANQVAWATAMANARLANPALANVIILTGSLSVEDQAVLKTSQAAAAIVDGGAPHFYAGGGFPPSFPFGPSSDVGYFANVVTWDLLNTGLFGRDSNMLTECGATTNGSPYYSITGTSQGKYLANQFMEAFAAGLMGFTAYQLEDGAAPYTGDSEGAYGFFRKGPPFSTLTAATTASATSIVVADGTQFAAGSLAVCLDAATSTLREAMQITAVSGNTLTVTRGAQGTTASAFASGDAIAQLAHTTSAAFTPAMLVAACVLQKVGDGTKGILVPKPSANTWRKLLDTVSLNRAFADAANASDTAVFVPGADAQALVVTGIDHPPTVGPGYLQFDLSNGSSGVWISNGGQRTDQNTDGSQTGGADVIPADCVVTFDLGRTQANIRIIDPMDATTTAVGAPVAFASARSGTVTLKGYPKAIVWDPPASYTQSGGDPRIPTTVPTGFSTFRAGIKGHAYSLNYGGAQPDPLAIVLAPSGTDAWTLGNHALVIVRTGTTDSGSLTGAAVAGSVATVGPFQQLGQENVTAAFLVPVLHNDKKALTVTGVGSWASADFREVSQAKSFGWSYDVCSVSSDGATLTVPVGAIPAGALGFLSIEIHDETGGETFGAPSDSAVVIDLPLQINGGTTYKYQGLGATVAAGRAAGPITIAVQNLGSVPPNALTVWVSPNAETQAPAGPTVAVQSISVTGSILLKLTPVQTAGNSVTSMELWAGTAAGAETKLGTLTTSNVFLHTGTTPSTKYYYFAKATNAIGTGPAGVEINATTPAALTEGALQANSGTFQTTANLSSPNIGANPFSIVARVSGSGQILNHGGGSNYQFTMGLNSSGILGVGWRTSNGTYTGTSATVALALPYTGWVRADTVVATATTTYYTSSDGVTWTQLGSPNSGSVGNGVVTTPSASPLQIGCGSNGQFNGLLYKVSLSIAGTTFFAVDLTGLHNGATSYTDPQGNVWSATGGAVIVGPA